MRAADHCRSASAELGLRESPGDDQPLLKTGGKSLLFQLRKRGDAKRDTLDKTIDTITLTPIYIKALIGVSDFVSVAGDSAYLPKIEMHNWSLSQGVAHA